MSDALSTAVTAQAVAALKRENAQLHRTASEMFRENQTLKRQLFHTTAVLDVAVSKLNAIGVSLEPPFDLRTLRSEVKAMSSAWSTEQPTPSVVESIESQRKASSASVQRRFRVQTELKEHSRSVQAVAFGPDDQQPLIASGGLDKKIIISNFMTGVKLTVVDYHEQVVSDVAWLSANHLLSASFDCSVRVGDVSNQGAKVMPLYTAVTRGFVMSCCSLSELSPMQFAATDSKRFVYLGDCRSTGSGRGVVSWECATRANSVSFDSSRRLLVTGHDGGTVAFWDVRMLRTTYEQSTAAAYTPPHLGASLDVVEGLSESPKSPNKTESPGVPSTITPATAAAFPAAVCSPATEFVNEVSRSNVLYVSLFGRVECQKLLVVSEDNMARVYTRPLGIERDVAQSDFDLENVLSGLQTRSYTVKGAYWKGQRDKRGSSIFDDGDREVDAAARHLSECDLVLCGGGDNFATVFDVSDGAPQVLQRLDGHRGRVVGAAVHHSTTKPIVATFGEDAVVKIWVPAK